MSKHTFIITIIGWAAVIGLFSCDFEKEVALNLPDHEPLLVVECFLEPGKPFRLTLTESVPFNNPSAGFALPLVENANVVISHNGQTHTLSNSFVLDPTSAKAYNYFSPDTVPADYVNEFSLDIQDNEGRHITGKTTILAPVPIDTLWFTYNADSNASITAIWKDEPGVDNFYRFALYEDSLLVSDNNDDDGLQIVFTLDDRIGDGEDFTISSLFFREKGDSVICKVFHINEAYWRYLETSEEAASANGNPFGQPASIVSTVQGGIGVFTGLTHDTRSVVID